MTEHICPLYKKVISDGLCVDVIGEVQGLKKNQELKYIRQWYTKTTIEEIKEICRQCVKHDTFEIR